MRIKSVHIKNYRALRDIEVPFDNVTTFIGPNGVGKSSILRALDWFFNGTGKQDALAPEDCAFGAIDEPIEVRVTFDHISDTDREALEKYAPPGSTEFTAWKIHSPNGEESLSANAKGFRPFTSIKQAAKATEKKSLYNDLCKQHPDWTLPKASSSQAIQDAMTAWESDHIGKLEDIPDALQTNFFGFNGSGKMSGLFDYVLVTADLRASEESIDNKSSIIARILERAIDRSAADEQIQAVADESKLKQERIYRDAFGVQLRELEGKLNNVVERYSQGRSVSVRPADIELKPARTTFEVSIHDGETETSVDHQGHGFQRTLLISALQILASSGRTAENGTICLAIEEPELFQHPIQEVVFAKVLRDISESPSQHVQVTYATHSPYFLEARHFDQVRRLTRSAKDRSVQVKFGTVDKVKSLLDGVVNPETVDKQLDAIVTGRLSIALFANRVLLVEGTTEPAVLYGVCDRDQVGGLEAEGVSIVPAGSKDSIALVHAILTSLDIPVFTLFDGDAGFERRANGKDAQKLKNERLGHIASNRRLLKYFNAAEVDFPNQSVGEVFAVFHDHLETFLETEWPEWNQKLIEVQARTGISRNKNGQLYRLVTLECEGEVPRLLMDVIDRSRGKVPKAAEQRL